MPLKCMHHHLRLQSFSIRFQIIRHFFIDSGKLIRAHEKAERNSLKQFSKTYKTVQNFAPKCNLHLGWNKEAESKTDSLPFTKLNFAWQPNAAAKIFSLVQESLVKFKKSTFNQINLSTIQDWMTINLAIRPTRQSRWTQAFTYIVFHLHGKAKKCHTTMNLVLIWTPFTNTYKSSPNNNERLQIHRFIRKHKPTDVSNWWISADKLFTKFDVLILDETASLIKQKPRTMEAKISDFQKQKLIS